MHDIVTPRDTAKEVKSLENRMLYCVKKYRSSRGNALARTILVILLKIGTLDTVIKGELLAPKWLSHNEGEVDQERNPNCLILKPV